MRIPAILSLALAAVLSLTMAFGQAAPKKAPAKEAPKAAAPATDPLDLNTATAAQLKTLPGIGDAYSKKIIDGRPWARKDELVSKGVLTQAVYDKIKDMIIAKKPK